MFIVSINTLLTYHTARVHRRSYSLPLNVSTDKREVQNCHGFNQCASDDVRLLSGESTFLKGRSSF